METVKHQNKIYFELKARELLEKRDHDEVSQALGHILLDYLNMKVSDVLPSP